MLTPLVHTKAGFFGNVEGEVRIPTYFRVQTQQKDKDAGRTLPVHAPRPFRPGSANRSPADTRVCRM